MNKFMIAYVAFVAIAANCVMAKPCVHCSVSAPSVVAHEPYAAPVPASVSYHAIPASAAVPAYNPPSVSYSAPSPPVALLQPIAVQASHGGYAAPSVPSVLIAAASRPVAQSSASTSVAGLTPGRYSQLAIPSYEILAGHQLNLVGGHANIIAGVGYGAPAAARSAY